MALDRTNMVSLLDIGTLTGPTEKIVEMGDGFTEITEDLGPNTESKQYVNMKNASNTVKGYALSMTPSREYLSDEMQKCIDTLFKTLPTGEKCNTNYYRFFKTDITGGTGDCDGVPVQYRWRRRGCTYNFDPDQRKWRSGAWNNHYRYGWLFHLEEKGC